MSNHSQEGSVLKHMGGGFRDNGIARYGGGTMRGTLFRICIFTQEIIFLLPNGIHLSTQQNKHQSLRRRRNTATVNQRRSIAFWRCCPFLTGTTLLYT
jgi:hypothetical protein